MGTDAIPVFSIVGAVNLMVRSNTSIEIRYAVLHMESQYSSQASRCCPHRERVHANRQASRPSETVCRRGLAADRAQGHATIQQIGTVLF